MVDASTLFPLVVPGGYLSGDAHALRRTLIDGLEVALVSRYEGLAHYMRAEDLAEAALSEEEALGVAVSNLGGVVDRGELRPTTAGDAERPQMLMFGDHWLAATCILLPALWRLAREAFGTEALVASIPHREALIVFPEGTPESRAEVRSTITVAERGVRKPITERLLRLTPTRGPWWERPPVEWL